ncbi:SpaA isopeptide-forming pilin-related protein [Erysipelothrix anatis]|uniref:SpaA isopeptide-forming pilin-related protein n=1 Tax=Erysipelothrix anatis TaxID=2683713 RepID=UPI0013588BCF|nr:SpaA isopeptide-forming pilin-related protein [Erysipelothrix anatis]
MKKKLSKLSLSLLMIFSSFAVFAQPLSADNTEVYSNEDHSVIVETTRTQSKDGIELDFSTNTDEKVVIDDIQHDQESIKSGDYRYSYVVGNNGDYKFTVKYTQTLLLEEADKEPKEVLRESQFEFTVQVNDIKEPKVDEVVEQNVSSENQSTDVPEAVIVPLNEEKVTPLDWELPNIENAPYAQDGHTIKEVSNQPLGRDYIEALPDNYRVHYISETGQWVVYEDAHYSYSIAQSTRSKRSLGNQVTTGASLSRGTSFYWAADPSFYFTDIEFKEIFVNGELGQCLEPSVLNVSTGNAQTFDLESAGAIRVMDGRLTFTLSYSQQQQIVLISNYGTDAWTKQAMVYEAIGWVFSDYGTGGRPDIEGTNYRIANHQTRPSWHGQTRQVKIGETLDLSEPILNDFELVKWDGLDLIESSGNKLIVRVREKETNLVLRKISSIAQGVPYVASDGSSQKVAVGRVTDPVVTVLKTEAPLVDILVTKKDTKGNPVAGGVIEYSYSPDFSGQVWSKTTDANGQFTTSDWEPGLTMYYREKSMPAPIIIDTTIKSHLIKDEGNTIDIVNSIAKGRIEATKVDQHGKAVAGAKFNLVGSNGTTINNKVSDVQGKMIFDNLDLGTYYLEETEVPDGLVLDKTRHEIKIEYANQTTPIVVVGKTIENKYQLTDVTFTKEEDTLDSFFPENHGKKLEGVELGLYARSDVYQGETLVWNAGDLVGKRDTNSAGQVTWHNVAQGEYRVQELKAIEGYQLFDGYWDVDVLYDGNNPTVSVTKVGQTITNSAIYGSVELVKTNGTGTARLEGAEFGLYRSSDDKLLGTYTSDEDGRINVDGLRYSKNNGYYFKEEKAPDGYWSNESKIYFDITSQGQTKYLIAPNALIEVHIEAHKVNEDGLPLEGVGFKIRNTQSGEFVTLRYADGKEIISEDIWFSDANGDIFTRGKLTAGEYEFVEVAPLPGYQPIAPIKFTVDDQQTYIDLGDLIGLSLNTGEIVNEWNRGNIEILKIDKDTKSPLQGWGFNLYDANDVLLGYYETGQDGKIVIENARYGFYTVEEIKVNGDYGIDPENNKQQIFVEEHGKTYTVTFENKHADIKTKASFVERDKETPNMVTIVDRVSYTDLWVGKEYSQGGFLMIKETNTPLLINGELVTATTTFTPTTKDGFVDLYFTFDQNALNGQTIVVFETLKRDGIEVVVHHDINDIDQTVENLTVQINKKDRITKERLMKAEFTMYDVEGNVIDVKWTDENGIASFTFFEGETVEIKETNAPEGYLLSDEVIRLTGEKGIDGNLYTIEYYNDLMPVVMLPKTGLADSGVLFLGSLASLIGMAMYWVSKLFSKKDEKQMLIELFDDVANSESSVQINSDETYKFIKRLIKNLKRTNNIVTFEYDEIQYSIICSNDELAIYLSEIMRN